MSEEWSDWILHDGKGCPVPDGTIAMRQRARGDVFIQMVLPAGKYEISAWNWASVPSWRRIIRYRIRKPRGMAILEGLLENLPATVEGVDA